MTYELPGVLITFLFIGIWVLAFIRIFFKIFRNRFAQVKTVKAVIISKQRIPITSRYSGTGSREAYSVVFSAEGKKLSFYVSQFSYSGYRVGDCGTLTYKGSRLIDFS